MERRKTNAWNNGGQQRGTDLNKLKDVNVTHPRMRDQCLLTRRELLMRTYNRRRKIFRNGRILCDYNAVRPINLRRLQVQYKSNPSVHIRNYDEIQWDTAKFWNEHHFTIKSMNCGKERSEGGETGIHHSNRTANGD